VFSADLKSVGFVMASRKFWIGCTAVAFESICRWNADLC